MSASARRFAVLVAFGLTLSPLAALADDIGSGTASSTEAPAPLSLGGGAVATTAPAGKASSNTTAPAAKSAAATPVAGAAPKSVDVLLTDARAAIAAKKWSDAIGILKTAATTDPSNADVQNLLGFSSRNNGDLPGALGYYATALKLNPKHTGALEYQGVAFIKNGELPKAKANLALLKTICGVKCEQYIDLDKAIKAAPKTAAKKK